MQSDKKISIKVDDPTVLELLPGYVQRRHVEIVKLKELLEQQNYEQIRIVGHNLKGSGELYGLPKIGVFGSDMEKAALSSDSKRIAEVLIEMQAFIDQLDIPNITRH